MFGRNSVPNSTCSYFADLIIDVTLTRTLTTTRWTTRPYNKNGGRWALQYPTLSLFVFFFFFFFLMLCVHCSQGSFLLESFFFFFFFFFFFSFCIQFKSVFSIRVSHSANLFYHICSTLSISIEGKGHVLEQHTSHGRVSLMKHIPDENELGNSIYYKTSCAPSEDRSACADAQADQSSLGA